MDTYFAPAFRSNEGELRHQFEVAARNPAINGVIRMVSDLFAVLNENRQILIINRQLLNGLGVDNPEAAFGLRPGEAIGCRYAAEMAAGCGTSEYCMTCGAVIAIISSLASGGPVERNCNISCERKGQPMELFFRVHASPIHIDGERFVLLFLYDISQQQRLAALERVFFHDINNSIVGLLNASELLACSTHGEARNMAKNIAGLTMRLAREVELQRHLSQPQTQTLSPQHEVISVEWILDEIEKLIHFHPATDQKSLQVQNSVPGLLLHTDPALILRVLGNMLINAFEAAANSRTVQLVLGVRNGYAVFSVRNAEVIPPSIAGRIFQRNFSTKKEMGRGLGTFSMKLIGEQLLGGRVYFESAAAQGTTFFLELPVKSFC